MRAKYELHIKDYCYISVKFPASDHYIVGM